MIFSNLLLASVVAAGVVHVPLEGRQLSDAPAVAEYLAARQVDHGSLKFEGMFYQAVVEIGTPAQNVSVCFDTGSPLLWTPGTNSTDCLAGKCVSSFDVSKSSSWKYQSEGANWGGHGIWGKEIVSYAGQALTDFNVYVSKDRFSNNLGIFGQSGHDDPKGSFVTGLARSGKISRAIYSINGEKPINWRDPGTQGTLANVYYGGFDKAKYEGPLTTIDTLHHQGYGIPISGLSIEGEKSELVGFHQVVLDTGGIALQVPNNTLQRISEKFGGNGVYETPGYWKVACGSKPSLTYEFGYTKVDVDFETYVKTSPHGGCRLEGVDPKAPDSGTLLSGPALISRALVIYDNDRDQITIGKAKFTSESDIVEITGDVPGALLYKDFVAGKPLPGASSSTSKTSTIPASSSAAPKSSSAAPKSSSIAPKSSSVAPKTSSVAPKTSSVAPKTSSVAPTTSKPAPKSSTLAIKTTSTQPQPEPTPTDDSSDGGNDNEWCSFFGTFCFQW